MSKRQQVLDKIAQCPPLPISTGKLFEILRQPDCDLRELARIIYANASLTARILRLANSAAFGASRSIAGVVDALLRIGTDEAFQIIMNWAFASFSTETIPGYCIAPKTFLEHSATVAMLSQGLAHEAGKSPSHELYTGGLLHDIGLVIIGHTCDAADRSIIEDARLIRQELTYFERRTMGIDHAEAGALLLRAWNLPEEVVEFARWHHSPSDCPEPSLAIDIVHMADSLSHAYGLGSDFIPMFLNHDDQAVARVGLTDPQIAHVLETTKRRLKSWFDATIPEEEARHEAQRAGS